MSEPNPQFNHILSYKEDGHTANLLQGVAGVEIVQNIVFIFFIVVTQLCSECFWILKLGFLFQVCLKNI